MSLWAEYDVLADAASFLTGAVHWARRAAGSVCIADVLLPGAPLIYVNEHFEALTGYAASEVLGRNCSCLQGPETEPTVVASLQACIALGRRCHVRLTNYRKDGSTFDNLLSICPVFDSQGVYRFVVGMQAELCPREPPKGRPPSQPEGGSLGSAPSAEQSFRQRIDAPLDTPSQRRVEWQRQVLRALPTSFHVDKDAEPSVQEKV